MGTDVNMILQKQDKITGEWETKLVDVFTGRNYEFFGWLRGVRDHSFQGVANWGLPEGFKTNTEDYALYHGAYYLGEHSFGHILVSDFLKKRCPKTITPYKEALKLLINDEYNGPYRLVFGFDS